MFKELRFQTVVTSEEIIVLYLQVRSYSAVLDPCNREKFTKYNQPYFMKVDRDRYFQTIPITVTVLTLIGEGWLPSSYNRIENGSAY